MVANVGEQFAHRLKLPLLGLQFNFLIGGEITYRIGLRFHLARVALGGFFRHRLGVAPVFIPYWLRMINLGALGVQQFVAPCFDRWSSRVIARRIVVFQ